MKAIQIKPIKTPEGWRINIPPHISSTQKRQRLFFSTRDEAERHAAPLREKIRSGEANTSILPPSAARIARRAFEILGDLPNEELIAAATSWVRARDIEANSITFAEAVKNFCEARSHRTAKYLSDYRRFPQRFSPLAEKLLVRITSSDLEKLLYPLPPVARNATIDRLGVLFNYSIKRGWLIENPIQKIDRSHTAPPPIHTLPAKQIRRLFVKAIRRQPDLVPMLAIEFFCGVRPTEATKISWSDFDFEEGEGILTVPASAAKTRRARHIAIHPTARAWLDWHLKRNPGASGALCQHAEVTLRRRLREIRTAAKIVPWPQDCARHTFASASLAAGWRDIGGLCLDLGHTSQAMLHKHYHRALRRGPAEAVFAVMPPKKMRKARKAKSAAN